MVTGKVAGFGPRLRELREAAGLTQSQLAEKAGLHPQGVVKLEREEREPTWATVLALADAMGVPLETFRQVPAERPPARLGRPVKTRTEEPESPRNGTARQGGKHPRKGKT